METSPFHTGSAAPQLGGRNKDCLAWAVWGILPDLARGMVEGPLWLDSFLWDTAGHSPALSGDFHRLGIISVQNRMPPPLVLLGYSENWHESTLASSSESHPTPTARETVTQAPVRLSHKEPSPAPTAGSRVSLLIQQELGWALGSPPVAQWDLVASGGELVTLGGSCLGNKYTIDQYVITNSSKGLQRYSWQ